MFAGRRGKIGPKPEKRVVIVRAANYCPMSIARTRFLPHVQTRNRPPPLFLSRLTTVYYHFMKRLFDHRISAVRFRRRMQQVLHYAAWGLFLAALLVLISPTLAGVIFAISVIAGLMRPHSFTSSARMIDRHYRLKDRILTAFTLLRRQSRTPMQQLQVEDAAEHLHNVKPKAVIPIRLPKMFLAAAAVFALDALAVMHDNFFSPTGNAEIVQQEILSEETVAALEEMAAKTEELMEKFQNEPALTKLSEKIEALLSKLDLKTITTKESLRTLSEMEEAFQAAVDALQLETMEESLQELAKTLELAEKMTPIGLTLEKGNYSQAAWELKKLDAEDLKELSEPERKAIAEEMQILAEKAEDRNQKPLQEAAQKISQALKENDGESGKAAAESMANEVEKHGVRQEIAKDLAQQQMMLAMMKANSGEGNMSGGEGTDKSDKASQTWGAGAAGNPNAGKETDLQGQRQQQQLTGALTEEGDTLTEMVDSQEMTASQAQRLYQEQFQQYRQLSEVVLDSEPIPMGQRQVIRKYFEAIRPVSK